MHKVTLLLALCALFVLTGCQKKAPTSDSTPPKLHLSHWEKNQSGGQGAQKTIYPGGQTEVQHDWIGGSNKADITVFGDDTEGVTKLEVSGSGMGHCQAGEGSNAFFAPDPLPVSFPKQTETVKQGYVKDFLAIHLDALMANPSCGFHQYGTDKPLEYFMTTGTWTISAHAENCCGGKTDGTFTIAVK
ncbi:MAG TPA: hypothetical protein VF088_06545 [Pyrinomonadaceae bacterium]